MSEIGFYHPQRGYWQTVSDPDEKTSAKYPAGTVRVPLKPGEYYDWNGSSWVENIPQPPTPQELEAEVQVIADELTQLDERTMALGLATVDLKMVDIPPGATREQVRQQFRDRVVFYLRERRGI